MFKLTRFILLLFLALPQAWALPYLSFNGDMEKESLVLLTVQVEASGQSEACYEARYRNGIIINNPHVYDLSTWTFSNYEGVYNLDYATEARLEYYLMDRFQQSGINGVDYKTYMEMCQFTIKKVELGLNDTNLVLTHSKDAKTDLVLDLFQGTTRAYVFNFEQNRNFLWFKINVK